MRAYYATIVELVIINKRFAPQYYATYAENYSRLRECRSHAQKYVSYENQR